VSRRTLLLCTGSHCRKALQKSPRLHEALARLPVAVRSVDCQKVCNGPVVGFPVGGEWQWFGDMSSRKAQRALAELVDKGTLSRALRKRRDEKRSGRRR